MGKLKIKNVDINEIPDDAKLCFVGNFPYIDVGYNDLVCYFTTLDVKREVWGYKWKEKYNKNNLPTIKGNEDKFFVVHLKDYITDVRDGVEIFSYQRDGWRTVNEMMLSLSTKTINSGFCGWFMKYNSSNKCDYDVITSNTTFNQFIDYFGNYEMDAYGYEKNI